MCESQDISAVNISTTATGLSKDLMLINVYDSHPNSSYKIKKLALGSDVNTMGHTLEFIASLKNKAILLVWDFNARTGKLNADETVQPCNEEFTTGQIESYSFYHKQRASKDPVVNGVFRLNSEL